MDKLTNDELAKKIDHFQDVVISNLEKVRELEARAIQLRDVEIIDVVLYQNNVVIYKELLSMAKELVFYRLQDKSIIEKCAVIVETLPLTLDDHAYPSKNERHLMAVTEAGCRNAFAAAIRCLKIGG